MHGHVLKHGLELVVVVETELMIIKFCHCTKQSPRPPKLTKNMVFSASELDTPDIANKSISCELESQLALFGFRKFSLGHVMILQDI